MLPWLEKTFFAVTPEGKALDDLLALENVTSEEAALWEDAFEACFIRWLVNPTSRASFLC